MPAVLIGPPGLPEMIIILVVIMMFFGVGKLPEVGNALGKTIRAFKDAQKPDALDVTDSTTELVENEAEEEVEKSA
jgi:sec-independent protein translocase protein TatA